MIKAFTKDELEREFFDSFRYFEPAAQFGEVVKTERPDFLIFQPNKIVGVEITSIRTPNNDSALESTKDAITLLSKIEATKLGVPSIDATLFFNIREHLPKSEEARVSRAVAQVVLQHVPDLGSQAELDMVDGQPTEVDLICVSRRAERNKWEWTEAGDVHQNAEVQIQAAIDKKAAKFSDYRQNCDECWLVVCANSFRPSGKLRLSKDIKERKFCAPFERTYFLDYGRGALRRLLTSCSR